jgi:hypothetical protein
MQYLTSRLTRAPELLRLRLLYGVGEEARLRTCSGVRVWPGTVELDWTAGDDPAALQETLQERQACAARALTELQAREPAGKAAAPLASHS